MLEQGVQLGLARGDASPSCLSDNFVPLLPSQLVSHLSPKGIQGITAVGFLLIRWGEVCAVQHGYFPYP